jgi:hypothetical protein
VTTQINSGHLTGSGYLNWHFDMPSDFSVSSGHVNNAYLTIWGSGKNLHNDDTVQIEQVLTLGTLGTSFGTFSHPDAFPLTQYFRSGWSPNNNCFDVTQVYLQDSYHSIRIDGSRLHIDYDDNHPGTTSVSEPGTLMLLGSGFTGLVGLVGYRRMRRMQ